MHASDVCLFMVAGNKSHTFMFASSLSLSLEEATLMSTHGCGDGRLGAYLTKLHVLVTQSTCESNEIQRASRQMSACS